MVIKHEEMGRFLRHIKTACLIAHSFAWGTAPRYHAVTLKI